MSKNIISYYCTILIISTLVYSQATVPNQKHLDSLKLELLKTVTIKNDVSSRLDSLKYRISVLKLEIEHVARPLENSIETANIVAVYPFPIYKTPSMSAPKLFEIMKGTKLMVYNDYYGNYVKVSFLDTIGYVSTWQVNKELPKKFKEKIAEINRQKIEDDYKMTALSKSKYSYLFNQYGERMYFGRLEIGMSSGNVILVWGYPVDKQRAVSENSVKEKWIYEGDERGTVHLYIENGKLISWEEL